MKYNQKCTECPKCGLELKESLNGGGFAFGGGKMLTLFSCWNKSCIPEGYGCYTFFAEPTHTISIDIDLKKENILGGKKK